MKDKGRNDSLTVESVRSNISALQPDEKVDYLIQALAALETEKAKLSGELNAQKKENGKIQLVT